MTQQYEQTSINLSPVSGGESIFVRSRSDLPDAVGGVITLAADGTYFLLDHIDLDGDRIVAGANTTILGASSENSSLTSTGMDPAEYLIRSDYTLPIRNITIRDVARGVGVNVSGLGAPPIALDWTGVNFSGCQINARFGTIDNFIFSYGAILGSGSLEFFGSVGTIGIDNSIFVGDGTAYPMITIEATAVILRRFRIIYSSFVAFGATVAINADAAATIPVDGYILDTCSFTGGGGYITGIGLSFLDNQTNWSGCTGILNTAYFGGYNMVNNAVATVNPGVGVAEKAAGTTVANPANQKFTHSNNRLTYVGALTKLFKVTAFASLTSGNNNVIGLYVFKGGVLVLESEMYTTTSGTGRSESIGIQAVISLTTGQYIEIWVENSTGGANITVSFLSVIVQGLD